MLALAAALFGACSDSDDGDDASTTAVPATATSAPAPTATVDAIGSPAVDGDRAFEHVRVLTQDIGPRVAGTDGEIASRDYIRETLTSFGYDVTIQKFEFDGTRYRNASVSVSGAAVEGVAFRGSGSGSVTGALVAVGLGASDEYPAGGLQGRIALIERGTLTFAQKAQNAVAAGASAAIIYNNEPGPFFGDAEDVAIPIVAITQEDGARFAGELAGAPIDATVSVDPPASVGYNVVAKAPGTTTCETVTGGHYDSVPGVEGADDNASGTAGTIEVARVVAARRLPGAHCFVLFGAEEFGLYGSQAFVDAMSDAELNGLRAMINLDVIGTTAGLTLIGTDDMVEIARIEAQEAGVDSERGEVPSGAGSDHASFDQAGVPVIFLYRHDPEIHTERDAIGRIVPDQLEVTIVIAYGVLEALGGG